MAISDYKKFRLINGDETIELEDAEEMKTELGEMVMNNSYSTFSVKDEDDTLVITCL